MGLDWGVALAVVVFVLLAGGLGVLIALRHKQRTGNDLPGPSFGNECSTNR